MDVDDDATCRILYAAIVRKGMPDIQVEVASNGADAVDSFASAHQYLIIMDVRMPVMDGLEAYENISAMCKKKKWELPSVIFYTGFMTPDSLDHVLSANPQHSLLRKPLGGDELMAEVQKRF